MHVAAPWHVRLQEKFEECEGEPEAPPAETQRARYHFSYLNFNAKYDDWR